LISAVSCKPHFFEEFGSGWDERWVQSKSRDDYGKFTHEAGKYYSDKEKDAGIKTSEDAKFYAISTSFPEFSNKDKDLVVQFTVKHEQNIDCGGGYLKLFPSGVDLTKFSGDTEYNIMFGPDICGPPTKKIHFIHRYNGENHLWNKTPTAQTDERVHLYQFVLKPDTSYTVSVDGKQVESGKMEEDWKLLPPKMIDDPAQSKPADWVDVKKIADPNDKKPEDWDNEPAQIADPDASKPDDWDVELDGEWEAPMIDNPKYKGEWKAKMIDNPAYKGEWKHPQIENPDYKPDPEMYAYKSFGGVGIDIWQVKSGSIFDNIWIGTDVAEANKWVEDVFKPMQEGEKKMQDEEKKKADEAKASDDDNDDDDDDDDDHAAHDHAGHDHDEL